MTLIKIITCPRGKCDSLESETGKFQKRKYYQYYELY